MIHNEKVKKTKSAPAVAAPPSAQKPTGNLAPRDIQNLAQELVDYHSQYADLYQRWEQREQAEFYLQGQLSDLERKTVEPMVLALKGRDPNAIRAGQQFLGEGAWDDTTLVRMSGLRWPVETAIEAGKSELGMDQHETRTWRGWHHQMTLTFLAHHFLLRLRLKLKKKPRR